MVRSRFGRVGVVLGLLVGLLGVPVVAAPDASAAEPVTVGNVTVQTSLAYDGTGHGTTDACWINSATKDEFGFDHVDDGPNDGVVCTDDKVGWNLDLNVEASTTPTVVKIRVTNSVVLRRSPNWANWCTNDAAGSFQASLAGDECTFTFPADTSMSVQRTLPYIASGRTGVPAPQMELRVNESTPRQVPVDLVRILGLQARDVRWNYVTSTSYVEFNGGLYLRAGVYTAETSNFVRDLYSRTKGYVSSGLGTIKVDVSMLPEGAYVAKKWDLRDARPASDGPLQGRTSGGSHEYMYLLFPVDGLAPGTYSYDIRLFDVEISNNYGGATTQPGEGKPKDHSTAGKFGESSLPGNATSSDYPNNDWKRVRFTIAEPTSRLLRKAAQGGPRPGMPASAELVIGQYPRVFEAGTLALCDAWGTGINEPANQQVFDPEGTITVSARPAGEPAQRELLASEYTVQYGTACTDTEPWDKAPETATAIKVAFTIPINLLAGSGGTAPAVNVTLPFKTGSIEAFPNYPNITTVRDTARISLDGSTWQGNWGSYFSVRGPYVRQYAGVDFPVSEVPAGNTTRTNYNDYYSGASMYGTAWEFMLPGDDLTTQVSHVATLSSCAVDATPVVTDDNRVALGTLQVTEPDWGPDGLPCTEDDVSGWRFTWNETLAEPDNSGKHLRSPRVQFDFRVPGYAKVGTSITSTHQATADPEMEGIPTATSELATSSITVITNDVVGQQKLRDVTRAMSGNEVGWSNVFFNNSPSPASNVEYIDVLPYPGDGRGTTGSLSRVWLDRINVPADARVFVTSTSPAEVPTDVRDPKVDPGHDMWCEVNKATGQPADSTCLGGRITAVYTIVPSMPVGTMGSLHINADTDGNPDGAKLVNTMGTGHNPTMNLPIPPTYNLETVLYLNTVSGSVYTDHNESNARDEGEPPVEGHQVELVKVGETGAWATTTTGADGSYEFTGVPDGEWFVRIAEPPEGMVVTQAWTTTGQTNAPQFELVDRDQPNIDFGLFMPGSANLTLVKTAVTPGPYVVGQQVEWSYLVRNTGNLAATGITVTDDRGVPVTCPETSLAAGAHMTCTGTGPITPTP